MYGTGPRCPLLPVDGPGLCSHSPGTHPAPWSIRVSG